MSTVELQNIWKIFGPNPEYVLKTVQPTDTRREVRKETGHVIAVRDVSLNVAKGEIFVVMGLSGSGMDFSGILFPSADADLPLHCNESAW